MTLVGGAKTSFSAKCVFYFVFVFLSSCTMWSRRDANRDLIDKPNRNQNPIESESGDESKGDINISL